MFTFCATCLTANRRVKQLSSLKHSLALAFLKGCDIEWDVYHDSICWECETLLLKMHRFIRQARKAQEMLKMHREVAKVSETEPLRSFSKLTKCTKTTYDESFVNRESLTKDQCEDTRISTYTHQSYKESVDNLVKHEKIETSDNNPPEMKKENTEEIEEQILITLVEEQNSFEKLEVAEVLINAQCQDTRISTYVHQSYEDSVDNLLKHKKLDKTSDINPLEIKIENTGEIQEQITRVEHEVEEQKKEERLEETNEKNDPMITNNGGFIYLSKDEEKFIVERMSFEEMCRARDIDRYDIRSCLHKCDKCLTAYFSEERYNTHMNTKHSDKIGAHRCSICELRFGLEDRLQLHFENHFKRYRCRECDSSGHGLQTMLLHWKKEHETKSYKCKICSKVFPTVYRLRAHRNKEHKVAAPPKCEVCEKTFTTPYGLKIHINSVHSASPPLEECPQCGGQYRNLKSHLKTHAPPAPTAYCAPCAHQFRDAYTYRQHILTHSSHRKPEALKHACPHCEARFVQRTYLRRHVAARHSASFTFYCDACGKGFHGKDRLRIHILEVHMGVARPRDKLCSYCGKGFTIWKILRNHIRTHTGEKPFQCKHCPWRFAQKVTLNTHVRALHPAKK